MTGERNEFRSRADRRRVDRAKRVAYDPKALNERHQEILNMHVQGMKDSQIVAALGVNKGTVSNAINSTLGQQKISMLRGARDCDTVTAVQRIQQMIPKALDIYEKILSEEPERVGGSPHGGAPISLQKATADTIVKDLAGMAAPKKMIIGHAKLTPELIDEIKRSGREAAKECGLLVMEEVIDGTE